MSRSADIERGAEYKPLPASEEYAEDEALLSNQDSAISADKRTRTSTPKFGVPHLVLYLGELET